MIDIEKFICSLLADHPVGVTVREDIHKALKDQGLEYKGGKIVPIEDKPLSKSEDERIRKELLDYLKERDYDVEEEWIAWLEKQGEHQKFRDSIQVGDKITRNKDGILVNLSQLDRVAKKDNKQGEQIDLANKEYWRGYREGKQEILDKYSELEKQGEQKPADKIEPKFKIGDFLVNDYCMGRVAELTDDTYLLDTGQGIPFSCEHNVHLWTLDDAKDGDVLFHSDTASNGIFVFKEILQCGTIQKVVCYCDYDSEDGFCLGEKHTCCWTHSKILRPATKEQRDRLFQKMKEAGYEWDADKKELKKIEQKKDIHNKLTDFKCSLKHIMEEAIECGDTHNLNADADMLLRLVQNPAWSEEDEKMMRYVIGSIDTNISDSNFNNIKTWFKSLKERYAWKPSDEQIKVCKKVYADILSAKGFDLGTVNSELNRLEEELKELKDEK